VYGTWTLLTIHCTIITAQAHAIQLAICCILFSIITVKFKIWPTASWYWGDIKSSISDWYKWSTYSWTSKIFHVWIYDCILRRNVYGIIIFIVCVFLPIEALAKWYILHEILCEWNNTEGCVILIVEVCIVDPECDLYHSCEKFWSQCSTCTIYCRLLNFCVFLRSYKGMYALFVQFKITTW
jgi:hypothetical protein